MKQRVFRIAWTEIENTIARKPFDQVDKKKFRYGQPIVETPESIRSYKEVVAKKNAEHPHLHHWLDFAQPDENGLFPYGNMAKVFVMDTNWPAGETGRIHGSIREFTKQLAEKHKYLHEEANQKEG